MPAVKIWRAWFSFGCPQFMKAKKFLHYRKGADHFATGGRQLG
jgi:hypothetical protein